MKFVALVLAVLVVGCAEWEPDQFPVAVNLDSTLSADQKDAVETAAERINDAAGFEVLRTEEDNGRQIQRNRIQVNDHSPDNGAVGVAIQRHRSCRVRLGEVTMAPVDTATHEMLHCLGLEHERSDPESIMFPDGSDTDFSQQIRPRHVDFLRELAGLEPIDWNQ